MAVEAVLLSPGVLPVEEYAALAAAFEPPLEAVPTHDGGLVEVRERDGQLVAAFSRAKRVESLDALAWLLPQDAETLASWCDRPAVLVEAVVPLECVRGLQFVFAMETVVNGSVIIRGDRR